MHSRSPLPFLSFLLLATFSFVPPIFADDADLGPLPRVTLRAQASAPSAAVLTNDQLDLRPLIAAEQAARRAHVAELLHPLSPGDAVRLGDGSMYEEARPITCYGPIVLIRIYGAPGTRIVYMGDRHDIRAEGWIELIVEGQRVPALFRWIKAALGRPANHTFSVVRADGSEELHSIKLLRDLRKKGLSNPDAVLASSAAAHEELPVDAFGMVTIILPRTPVAQIASK